MDEDILLKVSKPGRYIGEEWNISKKDFSKAHIRFALCFPDLYEVGMSNLGMRIIYDILNNLPGVICERFFSCEQDMEKIIRQHIFDFTSLESHKKIADFDILGFSLASELNYTNVLNILDLGNIPLLAIERDKSYPLVIGGGPCVLNPEPLGDFFDIFLLGETEELIIDFINIYDEYKTDFRSGRLSKEDLLFRLSQIEGVYVPSFYEFKYGDQGRIIEFKPKIEGIPGKIVKRYIRDLDSVVPPLKWLVPYIQIVHDRITVEVMRGCPNRCRFCQAKNQYFPFRKRSIEKILSFAAETYKYTGYEELSLCGLSVSDYPDFKELLKGLVGIFKDDSIGISLPSVKVKAGFGDISGIIATIKKTGLTFAPEAGSKRLRKAIAKDFDEDALFDSLKEAYALGYRHVKLYFMIGLPSEKEEDLDGIVDLAIRVSELRRQIIGSPAQVNLSINAFIPKPHTSFQWFSMQDKDMIMNKQEYIKNKIIKSRHKHIKFNFHNRYMSYLEGIFSRGDRRLGQVLLSAFRKGARFDSWSNRFNFQIWQEAFKDSGIDPDYYLKEKSLSEILPWDFVDIGFNKNDLIAEFNKTIDI